MLFQQIPETTESVPVSELRLTISPNFVLAECDLAEAQVIQHLAKRCHFLLTCMCRTDWTHDLGLFSFSREGPNFCNSVILFLISALSSFYFCVLLCFGQSSGCSQVNLFFSLYISAVRVAVTLQGDVENQVCECDNLKIDNSNRHHGCVY